MKRSALPWIILGCVLVSALLAWWTLSRSFTPEGPPRLEHRDLPPFHALEVGGDARVTLVQSATPALDVEAGRNARIDAHVEDGRLVIRTESRRAGFAFFRRRASAPPRITVSFPTLDRVRLHGAVHVEARRIEVPALRIDASGGSKLAIDDLRAGTLRVEGSGALDARLGGEVEREEIVISGAGEFAAERLRAREATVRVSGVGNVVVNVERALDASISGAGNVEYLGDPHVTQRISGIGRVQRRATGTTAMRGTGETKVAIATRPSVHRVAAGILEEERPPGERIEVVVNAGERAHVADPAVA